MSEAKRRNTIVRTSAGIRDALIDEMERIINGETDAKTANAFARLSSEVTKTIEVDLKVEEFKSKLPAPKGETPVRTLTSYPLGQRRDEAA